MIIIKNEIFVWLSIIDDLTYIIYLKLIKVFGSTTNLYNYSKNKNKFEEYLNSNNFILNENLKSKLLNKDLKIRANKIYNYLNSRNIKIIPITSKHYIKNLRNIFSPPLCIYVKGDILNKKKIYVYENENISEYARKIINLLYTKILNKHNYLILNDNLNIKSINLLNDLPKLKDSKEINIYYNTSKGENDIKKLEVVSGIIDLLVIPEADYNKEISILVDTILELGKEICIFPNEIFNKNAYFSNYLIKNGADILTNVYQIQGILNKL